MDKADPCMVQLQITLRFQESVRLRNDEAHSYSYGDYVPSVRQQNQAADGLLTR